MGNIQEQSYNVYFKVFHLHVPTHSVIKQVSSHNIYYIFAVTQCLLYRYRLTVFTIQVPSHSVYYRGAVTQWYYTGPSQSV